MLKYILFNAISALGLFFLNGQLGKLQYGISEPLFAYGRFTFDPSDEQSFSGNFFQKIVNPAVYMAVIAASVQYFLPAPYVESLWLLVPLFWAFRLLHMIWRNVFIFLNLKYEVTAFFLSILLSEGVLFYIILPVLHQEESIWIPPTALRDALWYAILAYIAKTLWEIMRQSFDGANLYPYERRRMIVIKRYAKFSQKYGDYIREIVSSYSNGALIAEVQKEVISLVYAIMIYEDYNRSKIMRTVERMVKTLFMRHRTMSLGIMQVRTNQLISDKESIKLAIPLIIDPFLTDIYVPIHAVIFQYNPSNEYVTEVSAIYDMLTEKLFLERDIPVGNGIDKT